MRNTKLMATSTFIGMFTALVISCNPSTNVEERNKAMLQEAHEELLAKDNFNNNQTYL